MTSVATINTSTRKRITLLFSISSVRVVLKAKEETDIVIVVSYVVKNASWSPTYDVRVFTKDKSMKVHIGLLVLWVSHSYSFIIMV